MFNSLSKNGELSLLKNKTGITVLLSKYDEISLLRGK